MEIVNTILLIINTIFIALLSYRLYKLDIKSKDNSIITNTTALLEIPKNKVTIKLGKTIK